MLKKLLFSCTVLIFICLAACKRDYSVSPEVSGRSIIWDDNCSGTATIKGKIEFKNTACGTKYEIYAVKQTKIGIYDSITNKLIETRFEVLDESKDRKKILDQNTADFSTTLTAGYYLIYGYPTSCAINTDRHWSFGDTLLLCGGQVKDVGTVRF
jgi:hypothetical protein